MVLKPRVFGLLLSVALVLLLCLPVTASMSFFVQNSACLLSVQTDKTDYIRGNDSNVVISGTLQDESFVSEVYIGLVLMKEGEDGSTPVRFGQVLTGESGNYTWYIPLDALDDGPYSVKATANLVSAVTEEFTIAQSGGGGEEGQYCVTVSTDKPAYKSGEAVIVSGLVCQDNEAKTPVQNIDVGIILSKNGTPVMVSQQTTNTNGVFTWTIQGTNLVEDDYTVLATANVAKGEATFKVEGAEPADLIPPTVNSSEPADESVGVPVNKTIKITFSEAVQPGSAYNTINLKDLSSNPVALTKSVSTSMLEINPDTNLEDDSVYTLSIPANALQDAAGNGLKEPYTLRFTTQDLTPPSVLDADPAGDEVSVPVEKKINITFNEEVQAGSTYNAITLKDSSNNPVTITKFFNVTVLEIEPGNNLEDGVVYTLNIPANAVQDLAGNGLNSLYTLSFTTEDLTAPTVESTKPVDGEDDVTVSKTITITFSEDIEMVDNNNITLKDSSGTSVSFDQSVKSKVLTINPADDLEYDETYTIFIPAGAVQDSAGNGLQNNFTFTFTTAAQNISGGGGGGGGGSSDLVVNQRSPVNGATGIELASPVSVSFNMSIRAVNLSQVYITDSKGSKESVVTAAISGRVLEIKHNQFKSGTSYTVYVPAGTVEATLNGQDNAAISWSFTTAGAVETPANNFSFTDLNASHWANALITDLCTKGIIAGYPDKTFQPENSITRAEFAKMIMNAKGLSALKPAQDSFSDVVPGQWFYGYVEATAGAGLVKGENGMFRPSELITRAEIAAILIRAMDKESSAQANAGVKTGFGDDSALEPWARGYVASSVAEGLIQGYPDNTFNGAGYATRAEACALISRAMTKF